MSRANMIVPPHDLPGYQAAIASAAYFVLPEPGTLQLQGEDRLAFLQRQTTNDIDKLAPGRSLLSVLVSPMARILDVFRLLIEGETLLILTLPGHAEETARYLKSRIFFRDKVSLSDQSSEWAHIDLDGPAAAGVLKKFEIHAPGNLDEVTGNQRLRAIAQRGLMGIGYRLLAPAQSLPEILAGLNAAGAKALSPESQHILRVEAGLPAVGAELVGEYTPLETGLDYAVAGNKGCYTGQEVIARQITYDKITQRLVGLQLKSPAQPGGRLWAEGKPVGTLTSTAVSPRLGPLALAIVRRPHNQPGTWLSLGQPEDEASQPALVTQFPLAAPDPFPHI